MKFLAVILLALLVVTCSVKAIEEEFEASYDAEDQQRMLGKGKGKGKGKVSSGGLFCVFSADCVACVAHLFLS